jgi:hypothetical protein
MQNPFCGNSLPSAHKAARSERQKALTDNEGCSSTYHDEAATKFLGQHHGHKSGKGTRQEEGTGEELQDLVVVLHTVTCGSQKQ